MPDIILEAKVRDLTGKKVRNLRKQNLLPAVVYGHGTKAQALSVDYLTFSKIYDVAGESSLIDLKVENHRPKKVLVQDIQTDPISEKFIHVDFHEVKMTEKIITEIELKFRGEAKAVKEGGGVLVKNFDKIKVECLPQDLVAAIYVDISPLQTFEAKIYIKDLKIPESLKVLEKSEEAVVLVIPPRTEEELAALEEKVEEKAEEVKRVGEEKKEEGEEKVEEEPGEKKEGSEEKPKE